jgi:hypothetical protein
LFQLAIIKVIILEVIVRKNRLFQNPRLSLGMRFGLLFALLSILTTFLTSGVNVEAANNKHNSGHLAITPGAVEPTKIASKPQQPVTTSKKKNKPRGNSTIYGLNVGVDAVTTVTAAPSLLAAAAVPNHTLDPRDMKILVIAADGTEPNFPAIKSTLEQLGLPYTVLLSSQTTLTDSTLWDGVSHGYYQGIILTTGSLLYFDVATNSWPSAFTTAEWNTLWNYEAMFGVRQVTAYTLPGWPDTYGLADPTYAYQDTLTTPLQTKLTTAGNAVFSDLKPNANITISGAWTYLATVAPGENVTPLLTTTNGAYTIAAVKTYADGRQNLAITADGNPYLVHTLLLSYGTMNWLTKGVFLGERHASMGIQPDDILIDDDIWNTTAMTDTTGITFRMSGTDLTRFNTWQNSTRTKFPLASSLKVEFPFNGEGSTGIYTPDTLSSAVVANKAQFNWITHTFTHANLDAITAADTVAELQQNLDYATQSGFTNFYKDAMVQPDISGLYNLTFQQAAYNWGIRYLISDTSRTGWNNPTPNTGFTTPSGLLVVPRHTTNLFYNLRTQAQWVSEYNCYYGPTGTCAGGAWRYWTTNLTYNQILDTESNLWLQWLLKWDIDPIMFHQPNTGAYNNTNSLLGDLINATLTKYSAVSNLPIKNMTEHEIGVAMTNRMAYNASGVTATWYPGSKITVTTIKAATIPVTGIKYGGNTETYGGQSISHINMSANQTISFAAP